MVRQGIFHPARRDAAAHRPVDEESIVAEEITAHDHRTRRCPMLGHEVSFAYCRAPGSPLPCRRILDCWGGLFDVRGYLEAHFSKQQIEKILAPPKDKMLTLVELIEKARKSKMQPPKQSQPGGEHPGG